MRLVRPSYEIWDRSGDPLALIERAGRVCYQSEPKGDPELFVKMLAKRRHFSVLEHAWFAVSGYRPFPIPPFMEWDYEHDLMLGNARAWRNGIRTGKVGLPQRFAEELPSLFGDLKWKIIFALRCASGAHPQMREVMVPLQRELAAKYPEKFGDDVIAQVREELG